MNKCPRVSLKSNCIIDFRDTNGHLFVNRGSSSHSQGYSIEEKKEQQHIKPPMYIQPQSQPTNVLKFYNN